MLLYYNVLGCNCEGFIGKRRDKDRRAGVFDV